MRTNCNNCGVRGCRRIHAEVNKDFELVLREALPKGVHLNDLIKCKMFADLEPTKIKLVHVLSNRSLRNAHSAVWKADLKRAKERI